MRVPQVNERVKEAPAQALRAMFAGIGQLMLFTDKLRNRSETDEKKAPEATDTGTATATAQKAPAETAPAAPAAPAAPEQTAPVVQAPVAKAAPVTEVTTEPAKAPAAPKASAAATTAAATGAAELPLPNYDGLTVASLRARLRNLNADQLTELISYEKAHANREDIIAMFERRIAKLAEG